MTQEDHIREIRRARHVLNRKLASADRAARTLAAKVRAAYEDGVQTGPISRAAEWSDTYVRSIREGKVLSGAGDSIFKSAEREQGDAQP
jgi:hypothetical protein